MIWLNQVNQAFKFFSAARFCCKKAKFELKPAIEQITYSSVALSGIWNKSTCWTTFSHKVASSPEIAVFRQLFSTSPNTKFMNISLFFAVNWNESKGGGSWALSLWAWRVRLWLVGPFDSGVGSLGAGVLHWVVSASLVGADAVGILDARTSMELVPGRWSVVYKFCKVWKTASPTILPTSWFGCPVDSITTGSPDELNLLELVIVYNL